MGYYATGSGTVVMKKMTMKEIRHFFDEAYRKYEYGFNPDGNTTAEAVWEKLFPKNPDVIIEDILLAVDTDFNLFNSVVDRTADGNVLIDLLHEYKPYHDEDVIEELSFIAPFAKEGEMYFNGDDDCSWRFVLKNGKCVEENGEVVYQNDDPIAAMVNDNRITVSKGGMQITMTTDEWEAIVAAVNANLYFREDVIAYLNVLIESEIVSADVLQDEKAVQELIDIYTEYRHEYDSGVGKKLAYSECMENAFYESGEIQKYRIDLCRDKPAREAVYRVVYKNVDGIVRTGPAHPSFETAQCEADGWNMKDCNARDFTYAYVITE